MERFRCANVDGVTGTLTLESYNHLNQVVPDYDAAVAHVINAFGAQFLWRCPPNQAAQACLAVVGGAIVEYVAPQSSPPDRPAIPDDPGDFWWSTGPAQFVVDYPTLGGHFPGLEFKVLDLDEALEVLRSHALDVLDQRQWRYLLTSRRQCHGLSLELTTVDWYSDPSLDRYVEPLKRAPYWADDHPLGITGFELSLVVEDLDMAMDFFVDVCGATSGAEMDRPGLGARVIDITMGATTFEVMAPLTAGPIRQFLVAGGERIRSLVFHVSDIEAVTELLAARGMGAEEGDRPGSVLVTPADNLGVRYEFTT